MVTPAGFEPGIAAVKGRCPDLLDERAISAPRGSCFLCCYLCAKGICANDDIVDADAQNRGKDNKDTSK